MTPVNVKLLPPPAKTGGSPQLIMRASAAFSTTHPTELAAQHIEEAAIAQADEFDGVAGAAAPHLVAAEKFDTLLAVDGKQRDVGTPSTRHSERRAASTTMGLSVSK